MSILTIVFLTTLILSFAIIVTATRPSRENKLIDARFASIVLSTPQGKSLGVVSTELLRKPTGQGKIARFDALLDRSRYYPKLELLIQQANRDTTPGKLIAASVAFAATGCVAAHFFFPSSLVSVAGALCAGSFPIVKLQFQRSRRLRRFDVVLPDAIDLMSRALKAGHSLASAIEVVAQQGLEPVASEFGEVFRTQNFGLPFRDAILQLAERIPSKDLGFLVTAMMVQKETGGNLTEILDRTTHVIRERIRIQGEVRTKTAQGRLTGWILSLLPIVLGGLINLINPGYAGPLFHDPLGQKMLYAGFGLIAIGGFIISKIVKIEV